jgi:chaperonin GroES
MKTKGKVTPLPRMIFNKTGIEPTQFQVLIRPRKDSGEIELKGGFKLYKPDETRERDEHASMEGEMIDLSPLAFTYEEWPATARKPRPGDTVIFARYAGITVKGNDGADYRLMNDKDIVAIREAAHV